MRHTKLGLALVVVLAMPAGATATPVRGSAATLSGVAFVNGLLTCNNGTWSGSSGEAFDYDFQFFRDAGTTRIAGAGGDSASYSPTSDDVGHTITCKVEATDPNDASSATSGASNGILIRSAPPVPVSGTTQLQPSPIHGEDRAVCMSDFNDPTSQYMYSTDWFLNGAIQTTHAAT